MAETWFKPWHALALGGGILGYALLSRSGGPRLSFSGPAEPFAPLEDETLCAPATPPGTRAFRSFVIENFGGTDMGIARACGAGRYSGHYSGKAWDWGVLTNNAKPQELIKYLSANGYEVLRRAGITYMIYNGQIWNTRTRAWQNYTGPSPHTDHVHFSFSTAGSRGQTSFYRALTAIA